jgi:hypothetical protein
VLGVAIGVLVYWVEAEKESRILCGLSRPGTDLAEIERLYGTANLLRVRRDSAGSQVTYRIASPRNLSLTGCTLTLQGGVVTGAVVHERLRLGGANIAGLLGPPSGGWIGPAAQALVGLITLLSMGWGLALLASNDAQTRWIRIGVAFVLSCAGVLLLLGG